MGKNNQSNHVRAESAGQPAEWVEQLCLWGLFALAIVVTWGSLDNPFILDDQSKILFNPDIRSLSNIPDKLIYPYHVYQVTERNDPSRPLVYLIYTLIYALVQTKPVLYHFVNSVVHGLSGIFVFLGARHVQRRFLGDKNAHPLWAPLAFASLFVVAPIQTGTVIYVYGLSDVLSSMFLLAGFYFFVRCERPAPWLSLICMFLALCCKQSVVVFPILLMLQDLAWQGWKFMRSRLGLYAPYWMLVLVYFVFRVAYFGGVGDLEGLDNVQPRGLYASVQPLVILRYIGLTFVPKGLAIDHYVVPQAYPLGLKIVAALMLGALTLGAAWLLRRRSEGWIRQAAFGWFWFLICLAPTSSIMPTVDFMVERRVYLASFGLLAILWAGAERALRVGRWARWMAGVTLVYALAMATLTWLRNEDFRSNEQAWLKVAEIYPTSTRALNTLANIYVEKKEYSTAVALYEKLIALNPQDYFATTNLGSLYADDTPLKDYNKALPYFLRSIQINPKIAENYYNVGRIYQETGHFDQARGMYLTSMRLKPNHVPSINNYAAILLAKGLFKEARPYLEEALKLDPDYAPAITNMRYLTAKTAQGQKR